MAPTQDLNASTRQNMAIADVQEHIKDVIQSYYQLMVQIQTYDPAQTPTPSLAVLEAEARTLSRRLQAVHDASATSAAGAGAGPGSGSGSRGGGAGARLPAVPPELIQYVEGGRNPDIYTREFVELVRRANQLARGRQEAFAGLRDVLAAQMRAAMPELADDVERVLEATGGGGAGG